MIHPHTSSCQSYASTSHPVTILQRKTIVIVFQKKIRSTAAERQYYPCGAPSLSARGFMALIRCRWLSAWQLIPNHKQKVGDVPASGSYAKVRMYRAISGTRQSQYIVEWDGSKQTSHGLKRTNVGPAGETRLNAATIYGPE